MFNSADGGTHLCRYWPGWSTVTRPRAEVDGNVRSSITRVLKDSRVTINEIPSPCDHKTFFPARGRGMPISLQK